MTAYGITRNYSLENPDSCVAPIRGHPGWSSWEMVYDRWDAWESANSAFTRNGDTTKVLIFVSDGGESVVRANWFNKHYLYAVLLRPPK